MANSLDQPGSIPEKTPNNEVERRLIALQAESDQAGFRLYEHVVRAHFQTEEQASFVALTETAAQKLAEVIPFDTESALEVRYFYGPSGYGPPEKDDRLEIVYPADSLHYTAYVEGVVTDVKPMLVEHPSLERNGKMGYRICAEIVATRVAGWHGGSDRTMTIYAPIGEISTTRVSYEQGMSEMLGPRD